MNKLQEKYQEIIETNYNAFAGTNEAELHSAIELSELTADVAIKFAKYLFTQSFSKAKSPSDVTFYISTEFSLMLGELNVNGDKHFKEFIQNHYEQENN